MEPSSGIRFYSDKTCSHSAGKYPYRRRLLQNLIKEKTDHIFKAIQEDNNRTGQIPNYNEVIRSVTQSYKGENGFYFHVSNGDYWSGQNIHVPQNLEVLKLLFQKYSMEQIFKDSQAAYYYISIGNKIFNNDFKKVFESFRKEHGFTPSFTESEFRNLDHKNSKLMEDYQNLHRFTRMNTSIPTLNLEEQVKLFYEYMHIRDRNENELVEDLQSIMVFPQLSMPAHNVWVKPSNEEWDQACREIIESNPKNIQALELTTEPDEKEISEQGIAFLPRGMGEGVDSEYLAPTMRGFTRSWMFRDVSNQNGNLIFPSRPRKMKKKPRNNSVSTAENRPVEDKGDTKQDKGDSKTNAEKSEPSTNEYNRRKFRKRKSRSTQEKLPITGETPTPSSSERNLAEARPATPASSNTNPNPGRPATPPHLGPIRAATPASSNTYSRPQRPSTSLHRPAKAATHKERPTTPTSPNPFPNRPATSDLAPIQGSSSRLAPVRPGTTSKKTSPYAPSNKPQPSPAKAPAKKADTQQKAKAIVGGASKPPERQAQTKPAQQQVSTNKPGTKLPKPQDKSDSKKTPTSPYGFGAIKGAQKPPINASVNRKNTAPPKGSPSLPPVTGPGTGKKKPPPTSKK